MFTDFDLIVVGTGLFGSVVAEQASRAGYRVAVIEARAHIGGNCYTEDDPETGANVHKYGPHIFHTDNELVWNYICQFTEFNNYQHVAKSKIDNDVYPIPINLETINKFFKTTFNPEQAKQFLDQVKVKNDSPANFEEQALAVLGKELYEAFFYGYTVKQLLSPYLQTRANILEEDPDAIDIKELTKVASDPKGLMGLYDYEVSLRNDPKWRFTKNAQDSISNVASGIAEMFGLVG
jgi:UDP-galactopyranose mutase